MRVRELCEAEKYLQMDMTDGSGAAIAIQYFVALRRETPDKPVSMVADEALTADVTAFEVEEDEASPPAGKPVTNVTGTTQDPVNLPTSGRQPSVRSA